MPRTDAEIDELKSKLSLARKRPVNFGFCLGRGGDGTVLLLHRRKPPELLSRRARKKGETQKLAAGQMRLKSRTVIMNCLESPPPMMARQMRLYLREFGILFKVDIVEPGGAVAETEGDDDGTDPKPLLVPKVSKSDRRLEKWRGIEAAFEAAVVRTVVAGGPKASAINAAWAIAKDAADNGKYKTALKVAKKLKPLIMAKPATKFDPARKKHPSATKWSTVEQLLQAKLTVALADNPANAEKLKLAFSAAKEKARLGDYKSAGLVAQKLGPALDKAIKNERPDLGPFDAAHDALADRLRDVGFAFSTAKLVKRLAAVRREVERPPYDLQKAMAAVSETDKAFTTEAKVWFDSGKSKATKALAIIKAYRGVSDQHARLAARLATVDAAFRRSPPDFDDVSATYAAIEADRAALKRISDRYEVDYKEWLNKKKTWCDEPLSKLIDPVVKVEKTRITQSLIQAKTLLDNNDLLRAKRLITDAYWDIKAATEMIDIKAAFKSLLKDASDAVKLIEDKNFAFLDSEIQTLKQDIHTAEDRGKARDYHTAKLILAPIPNLVAGFLKDAAKLADPAHLKALTDRADTLKKSPLGTQIQDYLSQASPAALSKAETLIIVAEFIAGKSPDKRALRTLKRDPKTFDDLLKAIPDGTVQDVLAVRYGASPNGSGSSKAALDLRQLHGVLSDTSKPPTVRFRSVTRDRDANYTTSPGPMFHQGSSGDVITSAYNPFSDKIGALNDRDQLGKIDADCVATCKGTGDNPAYGHWSTLHQIGKAINTRKKFMHANGNKKIFGGWQDHGTDISAIARTISRHFKVDRVFVERAMTRKSTEIPRAPDVANTQEWNKPYEDALSWVADAHHGAALWISDTRSEAHRIGTRVIHEAKKNHWVSYEYSARAKGVTGKQFRSPGDWFAELYAAYLTNVMHPSHPARDWLVRL